MLRSRKVSDPLFIKQLICLEEFIEEKTEEVSFEDSLSSSDLQGIGAQAAREQKETERLRAMRALKRQKEYHDTLEKEDITKSEGAERKHAEESKEIDRLKCIYNEGIKKINEGIKKPKPPTGYTKKEGSNVKS